MVELLTVTANPAIDRTAVIPGRLETGTARATEVLVLAGGKGINAARAAATLGAVVRTTGFVGGHAGRWIVEELGREGLGPRFVDTAGETRSTQAIYVAGSPPFMVVEPGSRRTPGDLAALEQRVEELAGAADAVALCGSLPPGLPGDALSRLVRAAQSGGGPVLVDTSGRHLAAAVEAGPDLLKVTLGEAADADVIPIGGDPVVAVRSLAATVGATVVLTTGSGGAVAAGAGGSWRVRVPPIITEARPIGSGDAFTAGLLLALADGSPLGEALRCGAAAGTANALMLGAGVFEEGSFRRILGEVVVDPA